MNDSFHINDDGLAIIKERESLSLKAYLDKDAYAIGYGHRGSDVKRGMIITKAQADVFLKLDCEHAETVIKRMVGVELTENQFSALVSFVYNIGEGKFGKSTLLKRINEKNFNKAADELTKWVSPGTIYENGLRTRREKEKALFLKA